MEMLCPHCKCEIEVEVKAGVTLQDNGQVMMPFIASDYSDRFPPTWSVHGGLSFEEVWVLDAQYMRDCALSTRVKGRLAKSIRHFISNKEKEHELQ